MKQRFTDIAPFLMLVITGITGLCSSMGWYAEIYHYLSDTVGYSLLTCWILLKRVYNSKRYCNTSRWAVYGLMTMNVVSMLTIDTKYYNPIYDACIAFVVFVIVYFLTRKNDEI